MPTIKRTTSLPVGGVANPLVGSQYEYLPFDALVELAVLHDGAAGAGVNASIFSGSDVLLQNEPIDGKDPAQPVVYPDDYQIQDVAAAGERLGVTLNEIGGVATVVRTVARITPL